MKGIRYKPIAATELIDAAKRYDAAAAGLGDDFIAEVRDTVARAASGERTGVRIALLNEQADLRHVVLVNRFPYSVAVLLTEQGALVIAVAHGRRRPKYWRKRIE